ncbi:uncharacterized protein LOC129284132 [Lytechinus pictus]|uniref:uncharacterized protein LOC129284132 n=1 Tax=Lytechinus pictus TaxID=7653 RepID=UPI0030B9D458
MVYCQAFGCNNTTNTGCKKHGVSFHAIPDPLKRPEECRKWIAALKVEKFDFKTYRFNRSNVVCSEHFVESDFVEDLRAKLMGSKEKKRLKDGAIPSVFDYRPLPKRRRLSEDRDAKVTAKRYLQSVLEEPVLEESVPSSSSTSSSFKASSSASKYPELLDTNLAFHEEPDSISDVHDPTASDVHLQAGSHEKRYKSRRRRKRKKISSDDDKGDLVKVHASCQTFHSGVKMTQDNFTQCPEDFSYVTDEHKYSCGSTQLLKPVISFSAVSQPFAAQEHSHPSTPEEEPEFQHVSARLPLTNHSPTPSEPRSATSHLQEVSDQTEDTTVSPATPTEPMDTADSPASPVSSDFESKKNSSDSSYEPSSEESSSSDSDDDEPDELRFCKDRKFVVFESQLNTLLYSMHCNACATGYIAELKKQCVGTMLKVDVICICGNIVTKWVSQPTIGRQPVGNILFSAALLLSGSSYEKVSFFWELFNIQYISQKTHNETQSNILQPVINTYYEQEIEEQQQHARGEPVTVIGDGRCDSPGYSAKFCTYTMMNMKTNKILGMALVSVKEATSSVGMEKIGCRRVMDNLLENGIDVAVFATDRHVGIRKMMKDDFPWIDHQFDVWHLGKSFQKRLLAKAKLKNCEDLGPWIRATSNHLWWSTQNCEEDPVMLVEMFQSMTHHVCDVHSWISGDKFHKCAHEELSVEDEEETKWLTPGSKSHESLQSVLFDKRLVKDIKQLSKACHTGELEVFHNLYLKYCPKRQHFFYPAMLARTQLAVLDHNFNTGRKQATIKKPRKGSGQKGALRYKYAYSKATKTWIVRKVPEDKEYTYLWDILVGCLQMKSGNFEVQPANIPHLPQNIAPVPRPPQEDLLAHFTTRFAK